MMKARKLLLTILLVYTAVLLPATGYSANHPASVKKLVAEAIKSIRTIDMTEFKRLYDKQALGLLIDVREPYEYEQGYIPDAVNIPRGRIEFDIWGYVGGADNPDLTTKMVLYCGSGSRCVLAAKSLTELGFSDVTAVTMKLVDWKQAGYPLEE